MSVLIAFGRAFSTAIPGGKTNQEDDRSGLPGQGSSMKD
jgi:hypothetical protein